jgi:hypothetical protein
MSIEMENPQSLIEMADALTNLVQQMHLAHNIGDEQTFMQAHSRASELGFRLVQGLQEIQEIEE